MDHINRFKEIKTFEELVKLHDDLDAKINNYKGNVLSSDYSEHMADAKYRNMIGWRIEYLTKKGSSVDQIES